MRAAHTARQEVVKMVHDHLGPAKALDVGQRHLKIQKKTLVMWFDQWGRPRRKLPRSRR